MLKNVNTIGIIALSGNCDREKVLNSKLFFENLGYKVKLSKNIFDSNNYLAGHDKDKLEELHAFFKDPEIDLIIASRGGYGAIRLINNIDYNLIKNNPKPICGFSDFTAILAMIYKKTGMITYHAPMACTDFLTQTDNNLTDTQTNFFKTLNEEINSYNADKVYNNRMAEGVLFGGNLSTIVSLCGLDFIPDENFIFFTEDINEPVYKIDKMFQQLFNIEKFRANCKGIVLGEFSGVNNKKWLEDYFEDLANKLNMPIIEILKITHSEDKITLPIGAKSCIKNSILTFSLK